MIRAEFVRHFKSAFPKLVGRRVLVALSGGADSVALLYLLRSPELELDIEAAHVHHGTRADEADRDAEFCEDVCRELGVAFHLLRLDADTTRAAGREGTWRRLRYRALLDLKDAGRFDAVATGHHRDDVAEGVLVQLLRGGGPRALSGIAPETSTGVVRPLLPWNRGEIRSWLSDHDTRWREDSSNRDLSLLRNRVRHQLLPGLETASPSLRKHFAHLAKSLATDEAYFANELAARALWIDPWEPKGGVPTEDIRDLPAPLRVRWLHGQALRIGIERVSRRQMELFEGLLATGEPRAVTLGRRWTIRSARGCLWLEPPQFPQLVEQTLAVGETVDLPLPGWWVRVSDRVEPSRDQRWSFQIPSSAVLSLRQMRQDDQVEIEGTPVRVSRIFSRTLPRHLRRAWPVFCKGDRIHWIPGVWQGAVDTCRRGHLVEVMRSEQSASSLQR
jgi:tRNA(Ile)-lysidine synthase